MRTRLIPLLLLAVLTIAGLAPAVTAPAASAAAEPGAIVVAPARVTYSVNSFFERRVLYLTNLRRAAYGCPALALNTNLRSAARKHSLVMARANTMSHQLPGEPTLGRRITLAGFTPWSKVAENIAKGFLTPAGVVRAWMLSPTHRRNILDCSLRHLGVGVVLYGLRLWWTQDFGRR